MVLDLTGPEENTETETVLNTVLLMDFLQMDAVNKVEMLAVFGCKPFKYMLHRRKRILEQGMCNILEVDPVKHLRAYTLLRIEICLIQDLLEFLEQGIIEVQNQHPELFSTQTENGVANE